MAERHRTPRRGARNTALSALTLALLLGVGGCASVVSRPDTPVRPAASELPLLEPGGDARVEPGLAIDRWWLHFDDTELHRLVAQALERNADLAVAAARLREARALFDETRGALWPAVDLQLTNGRSRIAADSPANASGRALIEASHGVALTAQYELDLWGRLGAASDAARQRLAAQAWARAGIEWGLSAQVAEALFGTRAVQRQIEISRSLRDSRSRTVSLRRTETSAGAGNEFELRRAEGELAVAESTLASLERQQLRLRSTLSLLVGEPIGDLGGTPFSPAPAPAFDSERSFEVRLPAGPVADLLVRRPDLREAEAAVTAARADIAAARAATLPSLRLSGSVGSDAREIGNLFSASGLAWSIAGSVVQSIFDGGRRAARVDQAEARSDAALAAYRKSVAVALIELREAYAAFDVASRAWAAEQQRVAALDRALALARVGWRGGALTQLDVLDAERNHFQAQLAAVDAWRDRLVGQVAAFKALGGGHSGIETTAALGVANGAQQ